MAISRRSRAERVLASFVMLALAGLVAPTTSAASSPGGLSRGELAAALKAMSPEERAIRAEQFTSDQYVVVAYDRVSQAFDQSTGLPIADPVPIPLGAVAPMAVTGVTNLTLTISVSFNQGEPCCRWSYLGWFDWTGKPPYNGSGKDQMAVAWANNLSLLSDGAYGVYTNGAGVPMNRNGMSSNAGVNWQFDEYNLAYCNSYADWGYSTGSMYWPSRRYQPTNVVFQYFHTFQGTQYSVSISGSGPSISISPTSGQESTVVYTSFTD